MGLIAHMPFLAKQGTGYKAETIQNSFSSVNTLSYLVMPSTGGPFGPYVRLTGSQITYSTKVPTRCKTFSIAFWLCPTYTGTTDAWDRIIALNDSNGSTSDALRFEFYKNGNMYRMYGNNIFSSSAGFDGLDITTSRVQSGKWAHIVYTFEPTTSGTKATLYINGAFIGSQTTTYKGGYLTDGMTIGNSNTTSYAQLSDVRIYDNALSQFEVTQLYKKLFLHYPFDTPMTTFSNIYDTNTMGLDATGFLNVTPNQTTKRVGISSATFNSGYITTPADSRIGAPQTVSFWAYRSNWATSDSSTTVVVGNYVSGSGGYTIEFAGTIVKVHVASSSSTSTSSTYASATKSGLSSGWHLFTFIIGASTTKIYIDAVLKTTYSAGIGSYYSYNSSYGIGIGRYASGTSYPVKDTIDDLRIYASELSQTDIEDLYKRRGSIDNKNKMHIGTIIEGYTKSSVTKEGILQSPIVVENQYYYTSDGAKFLKIFSHDVRSDTTMFANASEAQFTVTPVNRFSRLIDIPQFISTAGKYEFLLRYPQVSETLYNRWRQTANPLTTTANSSQTASTMGYEAVEINWTTNWLYGLGLSSAPSSAYMDAEAGSGNWWQGIGQYSLYNGGLTGPNGIVTPVVELYVRVDNTNFTGESSMRNSKCVFMDEFIEE